MTGKHRKPSRLRRVARTAAPLAVIAGLGAAPTAAGAQPLPNLDSAPQAPNRADFDGRLEAFLEATTKTLTEIAVAVRKARVAEFTRGDYDTVWKKVA